MNTKSDMQKELNKILLQIQGNLLVYNEGNIDTLTKEEADRWEKLNSRAEFLFDVLEEVDNELSKIHANDPARKSTLELLQMVGNHLSGKSINVSVSEASQPNRLGETWHDGTRVNILIDPRASSEAEKYLDVFLHEVAHAKKHFTDYGMKAEEFGGQFESEARGEAAKWRRFADWHAGEYPYTGAVNPAADYMRARLLALLNYRGEL